MSEQVLVVKRSEIEEFIKDKPKDVLTDMINDLYQILLNKSFFMERELAENDTTHKQIIPYVGIRNGDKVFFLKRFKKQGEARLHGKLSIGIGGHINPIDTEEDDADLSGLDVLEKAMYREISEEVSIEGSTGEPKIIGFINDDTNDVGQVHLGLLFFLELPHDKVTVKETEMMEGKWATIEEVLNDYEKLESWSQLAVKLL